MKPFKVQRSINGEVRTLVIMAVSGSAAARLADEAVAARKAQKVRV